MKKHELIDEIRFFSIPMAFGVITIGIIIIAQYT